MNKAPVHCKFDIALDVMHLTNVLHEAGTASIPKYNAQKQNVTRTKGRGAWNYEIEKASKAAKIAYHKWKTTGSQRNPNNQLYQDMKSKKKKFRQLQRQAQFRIRETKYNNIMESQEFNQKLFYKLIKEQRTTRHGETDVIIVDDEILDDDEKILNGWKKHFETLATPMNNDEYDKDVQHLINIDCLLIEELIKGQQSKQLILKVNDNVIRKAVHKLSNGKAPDHLGLTAEHLKYGVLKKDKDSKLPRNYRGIAVTPVLSKILETVLKDDTNDELKATQSRLQRGFTEETSPVNAWLVVTEGINEACDQNISAGVVTLDAEKAFDKLDHQILLRKVFHSGIKDTRWLLIKLLQTEANTKVKWKGNLSKIFQSRQGIRQGAKRSPTLYKRYNNQLLQTLQLHDAGAKIGTTFIGAPTVADDIALIAFNPIDLQCALNILNDSTKIDKITINSSKSDAVIFNTKKGREPQEWKIGNETIAEVQETTHIGIVRNANKKKDIESRIEKGRRTMYALLAYTQKELNALEIYERKLLKQIQGLPDRCANVAVYALLGTTPITVHIERNSLTTFFNIASHPEFIEHEIARRQLAMKDETSNSWFTHIRIILQKYNLPTAFEIMNNPPSKTLWKKQIDSAINKFWEESWRDEIEQKKSLKYLNLQELATNIHTISGKQLRTTSGTSQKPQSKLAFSQVPTRSKLIAKDSINMQCLKPAFFVKLTLRTDAISSLNAQY
ncbi:Hypothetical predicted protein [Mytilus galloprovincialis]|uniref:Reverse transcriptase domain-containing protein n=1 Tax=Mytilus galloprovincialis TaxID=29158 RepID=A0A8B6H376_MYTGA|nr:Hypothetical predicted protein [Mytilus galloprovincialis]